MAVDKPIAQRELDLGVRIPAAHFYAPISGAGSKEHLLGSSPHIKGSS